MTANTASSAFAEGARRRSVIDRVAAIPSIWRAAAFFSCAFAALIALYPFGVVGDYPNHLARTYIEAFHGASENLQTYYQVAYGFIPDLTMDITIPWLAHLFGVYGAGAIVVILSCLAAPLAGVALSRHLHGARSAWLPLAGFATLFSLNFEFGFINFIAAAGLALVAFVFWIRMAPGWRRAMFFAPVSLLLVINHALGFLLFGYLVLLWEVASFIFSEKRIYLRFVRELTLRDSVAFLPGLAFLGVSLVSAPDLSQAVNSLGDFWGSRDVSLFAPFRFYRDGGAALVASLSCILLFGGLAIGLRNGMIEIDKRMAVVCAGLFVIAFGLPEYVFGIWGLHFRFPPMLVILLAASIRFKGDALRFALPTGVAILALIAGQFIHGALHLRASDMQVRDMRAGLQTLPAGARVLPMFDEEAEYQVSHHVGALAVIEADAYVPTLFTNTSPVGVKPEWRHIHLPSGMKVKPERLSEVAEFETPEAENGYWSLSYFHGWARNFTHLLWVRAPDAPGLDDPRLCATAEGVDFVLYEVSAAEECER